jgi:hypothetical protein
VTDDRLRQRLLLPTGKAAERAGHGERQAAILEVAPELGAETTAQRQPPFYPSSSLVQEPGDLGDGQMIVVGERAHQAHLVHAAEGAPRSVGLEQSGLGDRGVAHFFDHHGDAAVAVPAPAGQALEAVQDLVAAVPLGHHAQGHGGKGAGEVRAPAPEGRERGGQTIDGDLEHLGTHGRSSLRARI